MIFPTFTTDNTDTLQETYILTSMIFLLALCFYALQYAVRLFQDRLSRSIESELKVALTTGLTANEENTYQCSPERGSTRGHGRWSATLRSGRGSPFPGTEKIQRLQG